MIANHQILNRLESGINEALIRLRAGDRSGLRALVVWSLDNSAEKARKAARHDRQRRAIEQIYLSGVRKSLAHAESQVLHKLHRAVGTAATISPVHAHRYMRLNRPVAIHNAATTSVATDFMFDLDDFTRMFFAEMREAGEDALEISGQGVLSELGVDRRYVTPHGLIRDFTIDRQNKLSGVPQEVYDRVKRSLEEGIQNGETMDELGARVQAEVQGINTGQAQTIARTETAAAYNTGRLDGLKQMGITHKRWMTSHDERVRVSHNNAESDGAIPLDQKFSNGLIYPGDPSGPPGETINCRCILESAEPAGAGATI